jgi:hypothetical protein
MLTEQDLLKIAEEVNLEEEKSTPRKVVDAITNGAQAVVGGLGSAVSSLAKFDTPAPRKEII